MITANLVPNFSFLTVANCQFKHATFLGPLDDNRHTTERYSSDVY